MEDDFTLKLSAPETLILLSPRSIREAVMQGLERAEFLHYGLHMTAETVRRSIDDFIESSEGQT